MKRMGYWRLNNEEAFKCCLAVQLFPLLAKMGEEGMLDVRGNKEEKSKQEFLETLLRSYKGFSHKSYRFWVKPL